MLNVSSINASMKRQILRVHKKQHNHILVIETHFIKKAHTDYNKWVVGLCVVIYTTISERRRKKKEEFQATLCYRDPECPPPPTKIYHSKMSQEMAMLILDRVDCTSGMLKTEGLITGY